MKRLVVSPSAAARTLIALALVSVIASTVTPAAAKRPVPLYDGREDTTTVAEDLLWVPRILVSPLYLTSEYLIRRPLAFLITEAERAELPALLIGIATLGGSNAGIIPTFLFDFGVEAGALPSAGVYIFWDEVTYAGHDMRLRAAFGGRDWIELDYLNRFAFSDTTRLSFDVEWRRRRDQVFAGIGPAFDEDAIGRHGIDELGGGVAFEHDLGARGGLVVDVLTRHYGYFAASCCEDPPIERRIAQGYYAAPPGLSGEHTRLVPGARLMLDTRGTRPGDESGVRVELGGAANIDVHGDDSSFLRFDAELGGYLDLYNNRVLGLRLATSFMTPLGDDLAMPFTELTQLGGERPMRAFVEGRLRDRSAIAAILEYRWPIWVWLDGTLFAEVGNVFGQDFDGFDWDKLRMSFGLGMRPASYEDHRFELLVAVGTEPFFQGAELITARVVFGTTSGF